MAEQLSLNFKPEPRGVIQVSASAGSGKTYRLALQYLQVLASLGPPREDRLASVVALTFTNQAAAEMRERILLFLKHIALFTDWGRQLAAETGLTPRQAEGWLETIFSAYQAFQVRTIDSLLFTLIRGLAWELGLRPDLSAEIREEYFLNRAFDRLLFRLREDPTLRRLFEEALETFLELEARGGFNPERYFRKRMVALHRLLRRQSLEKNGPPPSRETLMALEEELRTLGQELSRKLFEELSAKPAHPGWDEFLRDPLRYSGSKVFQKRSLKEVVAKEGLPRRVELDALERLEQIVEVADALMIARGDLGVQMSPHKVPTAQREIIDACNRADRLVVTATQMLESMVRLRRPT
ncbi:MAG: hypothetical protein DSZ24_06900, partial [Thermodesulfatator sp.]